MWCLERSRLQSRPRPAAGRLAVAVLAVLMALVAVHAGSAAAAPIAATDTAAPLLKVSGKASFISETRASGDGFEIRATLSDEVGRPLPSSEIRVRSVSPTTSPTFHRCGDARGEAGGELLLTTDKSGRICIAVTGMAAGSVELSFQDARGYLERTPGEAPWLADIHLFGIGSTLSFGPSGSSINAMTTAVPKLVAGITRGLFAGDLQRHWESLLAYDVKQVELDWSRMATG